MRARRSSSVLGIQSEGSRTVSRPTLFVDSGMIEQESDYDASDTETVFTETTISTATISATAHGPPGSSQGGIPPRQPSPARSHVRKKKKSSLRRLEDEINLAQIQDLRCVFDLADADRGGALDIDEFTTAFTSILKGKMTPEQLKTLFMKIDVNANGWIDWDEFSTFLLLGNEGATKMKESFDGPNKEYALQPLVDRNGTGSHHKECVNRILCHPKTGRVFTASRDGTVKVWTGKTLQHEETIVSSAKWINDMVYMSRSDKIAVCGMDRTISIYDCTKFDLVRKFKGKIQSAGSTPGCPHGTLPSDGVSFAARNALFHAAVETFSSSSAKAEKSAHLPPSAFGAGTSKADVITIEDLTVPMCMAYHVNSGGIDGEEENLLIGAEEGCILMYLMSQGGTLVSKNSICRNFWVKPHKDWVTKIKYAAELDAIISCSSDASIKQTNIEKSKVIRSLDAHKKAVFSIDWSPTFKLLASCGLERDVLLWNPFINSPLATLCGHKAPLVDLMFNDKDSELITLSCDKVIKIWDVRTFRCLQTLCDKKVYWPEDKLNRILYDPNADCIYAASNVVTAWPVRRNLDSTGTNFKGHLDPVIQALYNRRFNQVITADALSVCVWDVESGDLIFKFSMPNKVTCMSFDSTERRLIVGYDNGTVKIWNFLTGQVIKECSQESDKEITDIHYIEKEDQEIKEIAACGANGKIVMWHDNETSWDREPSREMQQVSADILCLEYCSPATVAVGTEDGTIILFSLSSGEIRSTLRVHEAKKVAVSNPRFPASYTNEPPFVSSRPQSVSTPGRLMKSLQSPTSPGFMTPQSSTHHSRTPSTPSGLGLGRASTRPRSFTESSIMMQKPDFEASSSGFMESSVGGASDETPLRTAAIQQQGRRTAPSPVRFALDRSDSSLSFGRHSVTRGGTPSLSRLSMRTPSDSVLFSPSKGDQIPGGDVGSGSGFSLPPLVPPPDSSAGAGRSRSRSQMAATTTTTRGALYLTSSTPALSNTNFASAGDTEFLSGVALASHMASQQPLVVPEDLPASVRTSGFTNIEDLLFLPQKDHTLVSCGGDGKIRFWDMRDGSGSRKTSLLYCLRGIRRPGESLTCLGTDSENMYLAAGDTQGFVSVWYIANAASKWVEFMYDQDISLVKSFSAHDEPVRSVSFVERRDCIVTGSSDCSVKLFTIQGDLVGIFGVSERWSLRKLANHHYKARSGAYGRRAPKHTATEVSESVLELIRSKMLPHYQQSRKEREANSAGSSSSSARPPNVAIPLAPTTPVLSVQPPTPAN